jgi:hypothetical protein
MPEPACGPFTDGYVVGDHEMPILPEGQNFTRYRDEECLSARPNRDVVREEIADYILLSLGAPVVRIELDRQQLTLCVDEALKRFEEHAPKSSFDNYYFDTVAGQGRYKLPCDVGIIRRVDFRPAGQCNGGYGGAMGLGGASGLSIPFAGSFYYPSGSFGGVYGGATRGYGSAGMHSHFHANIGEWVLVQSYQELFTRISSGEPSWEIASGNTLIIYPTPRRGSMTVVVNYLQRMRDWPEANSWMKDYALAHAKEILGRIRSKFDRYVSPGGGVTLDGQALLAEAQQEKERLGESLRTNYSIDHMLPTVG